MVNFLFSANDFLSVLLKKGFNVLHTLDFEEIWLAFNSFILVHFCQKSDLLAPIHRYEILVSKKLVVKSFNTMWITVTEDCQFYRAPQCHFFRGPSRAAQCYYCDAVVCAECTDYGFQCDCAGRHFERAMAPTIPSRFRLTIQVQYPGFMEHIIMFNQMKGGMLSSTTAVSSAATRHHSSCTEIPGTSVPVLTTGILPFTV